MKSTLSNRVIKVAAQAALVAGRQLLKKYDHFDRSQVRYKSVREILTAADLVSNRIIKKQIKAAFPDHRILSEESGLSSKTSTSPYLWIVDPLDGTTNFSIHNPLWAISIAFCFEDKVEVGLVLAPALGEVYLAVRGQGAYLNGERIEVSKKKGKETIHTFCHGSDLKYLRQALKYYQHQKLNYLDCRQMGSAALELAYTACGRVESLAVPGANSWDVAASALLVSEAKGRVSDIHGKAWNIKSDGIVASNGQEHSRLVKLFR